ncbi:MAG: rhodanese-related sulfurtransferase [Lentisphaerales bacterium]|nr:rhodanese-related sulfurtransferase [Lentisphaerales bacterium]
MSEFVVCALYKFTRLEDYVDLREPLYKVMDDNEVRGTLLLAQEGINGTISGSRQGIDTVLNWLHSDERLNPITYKESYNENSPYKLTKVKLKKVIVTMGIEGIDPNKSVGTYIPPKEWNDLISDPEVILVDTRNEYEFEIGTFQNAVNPHTDNFREFPKYVEDNLDPEKHKKVAMFCTGGIRCEKSTAFLKEKGFKEVYHLQGGILKYLEEVPKEDTMWEGECFVFDDRVAVNHDLEKGKYDQCHACRFPITEEEKEDERFIQGVSCPRCYEKTSPEQKARYEEREKQIRLAEKRGEDHIGHDITKIVEQKRQEKAQRKAEQQKESLK